MKDAKLKLSKNWVKEGNKSEMESKKLNMGHLMTHTMYFLKELKTYAN